MMMVGYAVRRDVAIVVARDYLNAIIFFAGLRKGQGRHKQGRDDGMDACVHKRVFFASLRLSVKLFGGKARGSREDAKAQRIAKRN